MKRLKGFMSVLLAAVLLLSSAGVCSADAEDAEDAAEETAPEVVETEFADADSDDNGSISDDEIDDEIMVHLDGYRLFFDVAPVIREDRTMVPFRAIFEALGCQVQYSMKEDGSGVEEVQAVRGSDTIRLRIGEYDMARNGKTLGLDVCPIILNGRTLVPLRAVSEALDCEVAWDGESRTVDIQSGAEQVITISSVRTEFYNDDDTVLLMSVDLSYPNLENPGDEDAFLKEINDSYENAAVAFIDECEREYLSDAKENYKSMTENGGEFEPYVFETTCEVPLNANNRLSILLHSYQYTGGAHPSMVMSSRSWDMKKKQELKLNDVLGMTQEKTDQKVSDSFVAWGTENEVESEVMQDYMAPALKEQAQSVNFYLTDISVELYYNQYDILPYAYGIPQVRVLYSDLGL